MCKRIFTLVLSLFICLTIQAQWKALGSLGFSSGASGSQSLAFHLATHETYVAFKDGDMGGKLTLMKYDGAAWSLVGPAGFSAGTADFIDLAFNPATDEPYIAFTDGDNSDKLTIMKFDGAIWDTVGTTGFSIGAGFYPSLAFHPSSSEPHVAFQDMGLGGKGVLMAFDGVAWGVVGGTGFSPAAAFNMSLIFDPITGDPLIAFEDDSVSGKATVVGFDSGMGVWGSLGPPGFSAGIAVGQSLAVDAVADIYLAFVDLAAGSKLTVMKFDPMSFSWVPVGMPGFTPSAVSSPSLAFAPGMITPFVGFVDSASGDHASVMSFDGASWSMYGTSGFTPGVASFTDMTFHPGTGDPYVAFADAAATGKSSVMWFDPMILPVELTDFEANWKNNSVQVNWKTASEKNNDFFILERSFDGSQFREIASISGKNNSNILQQYQYIDDLVNARTDHTEKIYYRLKQVDFDGTYVNSNIIQLNNKKVRITLSPNPTLGQVKLSFTENVAVEITVFDNSGKTVFRKKASAKEVDFDLSDLAEGLYWLVLESAGVILSQERLVLVKNGLN